MDRTSPIRLINKMLKTAEIDAPTLKDDSDLDTFQAVYAGIVQLREDFNLDELAKYEQYLAQRLEALRPTAAQAAAAAAPQLVAAQAAAVADEPSSALMARGNAAWRWLRSVDMQEVSHIGDEDVDWDTILRDITSMSKQEFLGNREAVETVEALQLQYLSFTAPGSRRR